MPSKRRNNGRSKKNRGHTAAMHCANCSRKVPKDKAIKKYQVRDLVDASSKDDIRTASVYSGELDIKEIIPKLHSKLYYCVSCAIHSRIVRGRSRTDRRVRKILKIVRDKPSNEEEEENQA